MHHPLSGIRCGLERRPAFFASRALLASSGEKQMFIAEVKSASMFAAIWFSAANEAQATIYGLAASGKIADCGNPVPDVAAPVEIKSDCPAHAGSRPQISI
jgi:hypothetical protein